MLNEINNLRLLIYELRETSIIIIRVFIQNFIIELEARFSYPRKRIDFS